mgnify:CR=1 FL=1
MIKPQTMAVRRKIMGVILRSARQAQGRTLDDCAQMLQTSSEEMAKYERGECDISLPELEALSRFLQVPVLDILAGKMPPAPSLPASRSPQARLLRCKIIGTLLRKTRQDAGKTVEEASVQIGCSPETLTQYERGQNDIPALQLQMLTDFFGVPFEGFLESPAAEARPPSPSPTMETRQPLEALAHLPAEFRDFLAAPRNMPFIQIAMELSRFSPQGLRAIAEALLAAQSSG